MPDVIVIGGGMIGATTAWQLAERGAEVLLLERGHLASGATRRSQGLLLEPEGDPMRPLVLRRGAAPRARGPPRRSQGLLLEPEVDPMRPLFAESNRLYDHLAESA